MTATLSDPAQWPDLYGDVLYRHAFFRLRDEMLAEELVQETFLAALKSRQNFAGKSSEKTWLIGILKHKIVDHIRKAVREQPQNEVFQELDEIELDSFDGKGHWKFDVRRWSDPDNALEQRQFWAVLEACIARLPQRMASLFILREIDGLDSASICKELELSSTNNLWTLLSRMRMRLRQCLELQWFGRGKHQEDKS
jgi:RNA polymerase sigma-70 factor (ECF subfamily)